MSTCLIRSLEKTRHVWKIPCRDTFPRVFLHPAVYGHFHSLAGNLAVHVQTCQNTCTIMYFLPVAKLTLNEYMLQVKWTKTSWLDIRSKSKAHISGSGWNFANLADKQFPALTF